MQWYGFELRVSELHRRVPYQWLHRAWHLMSAPQQSILPHGSPVSGFCGLRTTAPRQPRLYDVVSMAACSMKRDRPRLILRSSVREGGYQSEGAEFREENGSADALVFLTIFSMGERSCGGFVVRYLSAGGERGSRLGMYRSSNGLLKSTLFGWSAGRLGGDLRGEPSALFVSYSMRGPLVIEAAALASYRRERGFSSFASSHKVSMPSQDPEPSKKVPSRRFGVEKGSGEFSNEP